jgi:hypothetical protein
VQQIQGFRISEILVFAFYAQTLIVSTTRLASTMEGEGSLVHCADVIAIETVYGADDDMLTVVLGAKPVGSEEPVHVGNKRGRGIDSCVSTSPMI